jgi:hypothetical protein
MGNMCPIFNYSITKSRITRFAVAWNPPRAKTQG